MYLTELRFKNFRNLKDEVLFPCRGVNVVCGGNANGKTNILEGIWLFCGGHSFRRAKESELINFKSESALAQACFFSGGYEQTIKAVYTKDKRELYLNGIQKSGAQASQRFPAVVFFPDNMTLVKNGPDERRRFLDGAAAKRKIKYAAVLSKFSKTLRQRNALLKEIYKNPSLEEILSVWDKSLSFLAAQLICEREEYVRLLSESAALIHRGISENREKLEIRYVSTVKYKNVDNFEEIEEIYLKQLKERRKEDIRYAATSVGPHRDDIEIMLNSNAARSYASQGQQRSIVISLKLAEADILAQNFGEEPIIILDDVLSELDLKRQDFLLNRILNRQVFLSCCGPMDLGKLSYGKVFSVSDGAVREETEKEG